MHPALLMLKIGNKIIAMFTNRELLKNEMYEQQKSVMITRGDKIVMFGKDASDSLKRKALKFINE